MTASLQRVSAITRQSLLQFRRTRMLLFPILLALGMLLFLFAHESQGENRADLIEATTQYAASWFVFFGSMLAVVIGTSQIATEIENATIQTVAVRPISRTGIVLGKIFAVWIFIAGCYLLWALESAGLAWLKLGSSAFWPMLGSVGLTALPVFLIGAIAITMSSRSGRNSALVLTAAIWFSGYAAHGVASEPNVPSMYLWIQDLAKVIERIVPLDYLGQLRTAIVQDNPITADHWISLATVFAWVALAAASFRFRRNIAS